MEIQEVFYPRKRAEWRNWLEIHHRQKPEVWLQTFTKASGQPSISYDDMVEECLCFGWIDGAVKKYDEDSKVQRCTPRRKKSSLSELNRQRIWKLQEQGLIYDGALDIIHSQVGSPDDPFSIPEWIINALQNDEAVWANFNAFPHFYKRLKVGWICEITGNSRQEEAQKRLDYLIKMTKQGKMYGTQPLKHLYL